MGGWDTHTHRQRDTHTKFGPVTGIPERHAYFKTTKQDRDWGPRWWEGGKLGEKLLSDEQLSLLGKT